MKSLYIFAAMVATIAATLSGIATGVGIIPAGIGFFMCSLSFGCAAYAVIQAEKLED